MGRDLRLELQESLSIVRYYNSFLFYRYQFDNSDLLEMSWTANFGTRRRITRLISTRIKDLYEKEMDCYTIRWYEKVTEDNTTYAIEVMVRLLESVKIPISNNIILSSLVTPATFKLVPAYYRLIDINWIQTKLNYGQPQPRQYQGWHSLESTRWLLDGDNETYEELNPLLHHLDNISWAQSHKLTLVNLSMALGVQSEMLRRELDNRDTELEKVLYYVNSDSGGERVVIQYANSTTTILDSM